MQGMDSRGVNYNDTKYIPPNPQTNNTDTIQSDTMLFSVREGMHVLFRGHECKYIHECVYMINIYLHE